MSALAPAFLPSLAWALLDFVWQGALVGWGAALVLGAMRRASPQARYAVACAALLLCAALPVAGLLQRLAAQDVATALPASLITNFTMTSGAAATDAMPAALPLLVQVQDSLQQRLPLVLML